jgi:hypothetical protein
MTAATTTILRAIWDPKLFGPWFKNPDGWAAWHAFLLALFALPLSESDLAIYQQCTGRTEAPSKPATEGWLICGRRAGKSFMLALIATYLACFHQYRRYLAPGERATIMIIARDRKLEPCYLWLRPRAAHPDSDAGADDRARDERCF